MAAAPVDNRATRSTRFDETGQGVRTSHEWKIEVISPLCQKIRTIEFTLKISSKSKITRLHADLNPLSKTQKNLPFGENRERFYARWRERAREIPGARIHPYNMLLLTLTKSKQQRMDEHEDSVRVL